MRDVLLTSSACRHNTTCLLDFTFLEKEFSTRYAPVNSSSFGSL
ncbi:MAG: hypothetical protein JWL77_3997 [Chthonomonadaceae bacterium]|nr:hypothetical protein [Chthonomonadaceae bacterium]